MNEANLKFEFKNIELANNISPSKQSILAKIVREAINNVIKHAHATSVIGSFELKNKQIILCCRR